MTLQSPWFSLVALALMIAAILAGAGLRRRWPEHHTNRETIELLQTTVTLLATFAAIVLGLLITSAKADFDTLQNDIRSFGATLVQLDYNLEGLGPDAIPIRHRLVRYAATTVTAIWTSEPAPPGDYYPRLAPTQRSRMGATTATLGQMLERANTSLESLVPDSSVQARRQGSAQRMMNIAITERWHFAEASRGTLSTPFFAVLVFWAVVIYVCLGLSAPLNHVSFLTMTLSAIALSSALFVMIDLYTPFTGIFKVSSQPLRAAIGEMLALPNGRPAPLTAPCSQFSPKC
jgi:hypothetical protein